MFRTAIRQIHLIGNRGCHDTKKQNNATGKTAVPFRITVFPVAHIFRRFRKPRRQIVSNPYWSML